MIEAVNSTVVNASALRANAEQVDAARAYAANPGRSQEAASLPQAPYVSPYIFVDVNYDKAVLQIRNGDTGEVENQFPSESSLRLQSRAQSAQAQVHAPGSSFAASEGADASVAHAAQAQIASAALANAAQTASPETSSATVIATA